LFTVSISLFYDTFNSIFSGRDLKKEVKQFLESEDNIFAMELKKCDKQDITLNLTEDFPIVITVVSAGVFQVSSTEDAIESIVKKANGYCKQGKKKVKDVLTFLTESYSDFGNDEGKEPTPIEMGQDDDHFVFEKIEKPKDKFSNIEEEKKKFKISQNASKQAVDRLMKDYIELCSSEHSLKLGFKAFPKNNDLFIWEVQLFDFDKSVCKDFVGDLQKYAKAHNGQDFVRLEMKFPEGYPFKPPFLRVISPRFAFHTGRVTVGGSICFELLTGSGWKPINDLESIFLQIKLEMTNGKPRVDWEKDYEYTEQEAKDAFFRVAQDHGWSTQGL